MPTATYTFPAGFLWGSATAAFQVEGHYPECSWKSWTEEPGRIQQGMKPGLACDWWGGRWKEDFDRAAEAGQNAHRLSVDWARIQPSADRWDEDALDYYRQIIRGAVERGLMPMVTLHHFNDPLWFYEAGGWANPQAPAWFEAFTRKVVEALKEYVSLWVTINEPNVYYFNGYFSGEFPPGHKNDLESVFSILCNMLRGHAAAYRAIHDIQKTARVGFSHHHRPLRPARSWMPLDRLLAWGGQKIMNAFPLALIDGRVDFLYKRVRIPEAANTQDFFGLNYYAVDEVKFILNSSKGFNQRNFPAGAEVSSTGFLANVPVGMFESVRWARRFKLPVLITENGIEDPTDDLRPRYMVEHLHQIWRAITFGWQIKGYFHWSLVDNFEWERAWSQRFGLWGLDTATQARLRRPSVDIYAEICRSNGISSQMIAKYVPELSAKLFPG
jgi:beta-glucosidase